MLALLRTPALAVATKGRYYLRRTDDGSALPMFDEHGNPSGATLPCHVALALPAAVGSLQSARGCVGLVPVAWPCGSRREADCMRSWT